MGRYKSSVWVKAFKETIELVPDGVEVVTVCDQEADIYEMFTLAQEEQGAKLLVRASTDRLLAEKNVGKLWGKVEQQDISGYLNVNICKNQKQEARQTTVAVRFTEVKLSPPWRPNQIKLPIVTLNAILVREENPADDVDDPIEWLLLTNLRSPISRRPQVWCAGTVFVGKSKSFTKSSSLVVPLKIVDIVSN